MGWEYWHTQLLSDIARGVEIPLKINDATLKGDYGHYARVLIVVDLMSPLSDELMMERNGAYLFISLLNKNLPEFSSTCNSVGYSNSSRHWKETNAWKSIKKREPSKAPRGRSQVLRRRSKSHMAYMRVERFEKQVAQSVMSLLDILLNKNQSDN